MPEIELWGQANSWRGCGRFEFTDIPYLTSLSLGAARCITMKALVSQLLTYYWMVRFFTSLPNLASTPSYPSENFCKDSGEGNAKSRFLLARILLQVAHEMPVTFLPFCQVLYVMSLSLMFCGSAPIQCRQSPRRRATAPNILQVSNPSDSRLSSSLLLKHASSHHELINNCSKTMNLRNLPIAPHTIVLLVLSSSLFILSIVLLALQSRVQDAFTDEGLQYPGSSIAEFMFVPLSPSNIDVGPTVAKYALGACTLVVSLLGIAWPVLHWCRASGRANIIHVSRTDHSDTAQLVNIQVK